jgi:hypothetical protein
MMASRSSLPLGDDDLHAAVLLAPLGVYWKSFLIAVPALSSVEGGFWGFSTGTGRAASRIRIS